MSKVWNGSTPRIALGAFLSAVMVLLVFILGSFRSEVAAVGERSRTNETELAVAQNELETVKEDIREIKIDIRSIAEAVGARRGER